MSIIVLTEAEKSFDLLPWLIELESIGNCTGTDADIQAVTRSILRIGIVARRERDEAFAALAIAQAFLKAQREQKRLMLDELHRLEGENGRLRKDLAAAGDHIHLISGERDKLAAELQESELAGPFGAALVDLYISHRSGLPSINRADNLFRLQAVAMLAVQAYEKAREDELRSLNEARLDEEEADDPEDGEDNDPEDLDDPDACEGLDEEDGPTLEEMEAEAEAMLHNPIVDAIRKGNEAECNEACCGKLSRMEEAMKKASGHP